MARIKLTPKDLSIIEKRTRESTIEKTAELYSVAVAMVLRDKWGFGQKRLQRFMKQLEDMFDSLDKEYVSFDDCKEVLYKECGIKFK